MKYELYAVINKNWKENGWKDPFREQTMDTRGGLILGLAIFLTRKKAMRYKKFSNGKGDEIIKLEVGNY